MREVNRDRGGRNKGRKKERKRVKQGEKREESQGVKGRRQIS